MPEAKDAGLSAWFAIDFGGTVAGAFRECTGFGSEHEVVEHKATLDGKEVLQMLPGRMKWNKITLKRGITDSMDMWNWRKQVEEGKVEDARQNGTITMYTPDGQALAKWDFVRAWPCKLTGPAPNANSSEVAIEELEITHEGYKRSQ